MSWIKECLEKNKFIIIIFICTIFILVLPNLHQDLVIGDDYVYHTARLQGIADSLKNGVFPIKINSTMANSFGYASATFYPDFFLYIPAVMMIIFNMNIIMAYKIFIFLYLSFTFIVFYKSFYYLTKNKYSAIFGTIFLMLSRILCMSLYYRFTLGEFLGFTFILPAIVGMYDYVYNDFKKPQFLIIGFFGLINTHLISGLIVLCFSIVFFIFNIKVTIKSPKRFLKLCGCALLVLLMSAFFWAPMIEQLLAQTLRLTDPWIYIADHDYSLFDYFANDSTGIGFTILLTLPIMIYALVNHKFDKYGKIYFWCYIIFSAVLVCPLFWNIFGKQLNVIQFRWRLLGTITTIYAISLTFLFQNNLKNYSDEKIEKIIILVEIILIFFTINNYYIDNRVNNRIPYINLNAEIISSKFSLGGGYEYLPIEMNDGLEVYKLNTNNAYIGEEQEVVEGLKYANLHYEFTYNKDTGNDVIIPFVYYYGYSANIKTDTGEVYPLEVSKAYNGMVKIKLNEGQKGKVSVWYNGTKTQKISFLISITTIVMTIGVLILKKR